MSNFKDDVFNDIQTSINALMKLNDCIIEIGVIDSNADRNKTTSKYGLQNANDLNNAQLMFIHENGSPLRNIPARPVLQLTFDHSKDTILEKALDNCVKLAFSDPSANLITELDKAAIKIENYARDIIYKSDLLEPNSAKTIAAKGSDRPLLNTGQLARSITCRILQK